VDQNAIERKRYQYLDNGDILGTNLKVNKRFSLL